MALPPAGCCELGHVLRDHQVARVGGLLLRRDDEHLARRDQQARLRRDVGHVLLALPAAARRWRGERRGRSRCRVLGVVRGVVTHRRDARCVRGWLVWPQVPAAVAGRGRGLGWACERADGGREGGATGGGRGRKTRLPFLKVGCRSSICARVVDFHWSELIWSKMIAGQPRPIPMFGTEPFDGCTSGNILMGSKSLTSLDSGLEVQR